MERRHATMMAEQFENWAIDSAIGYALADCGEGAVLVSVAVAVDAHHYQYGSDDRVSVTVIADVPVKDALPERGG